VGGGLGGLWRCASRRLGCLRCHGPAPTG
jgi:hypothetical protein